MTFGKRTVDTFRPAAAPGSADHKAEIPRWGLPKAIVVAALSFAVSGSLLVLIYIGAIGRRDPAPIMLMLIFGAVPTAAVGYALALTVIDIVFRRLRIVGPIAYAVSAAAGACLVSIPLGALFNGWNGVAWWPALLVPGGLAGGVAVGYAPAPLGRLRQALVGSEPAGLDIGVGSQAV